MKKFLESVAEVYYENQRDELRDYVFVFPNRRAGTFFMHYLRRIAKTPVLAPEIMTLTELVESWSSLSLAPAFEQLLTLYDLHTRHSDDTFDRFRYWGEMILNDFNDIDRSLVDAKGLFGNVSRLAEISTDYLTDEQREVIERYWPHEARPRTSGNSFWNHLSDENGDYSQRWNELLELYEGLHESLRSRGMATPGMFLREAVRRLTADGIHQLRHKRHIFVGFSYLSAAELKIFHLLDRFDVADFYWNDNSPGLRSPNNPATLWIRHYAKTFRSRYTLNEPEIKSWPEIEIIGAPSKTGQCSVLGERLEARSRTLTQEQQSNAIDTAIVLPDESLLLQVISAIPEEYTTLNVTMGVPMRTTPVASLISKLTLLHGKSSIRRGKPSFYHEYVRTLLTNPLINKISPDGCERLLSVMTRDRMFQVDIDIINEVAPALAPIFDSAASESFESVKEYFIRISSLLLSHLESDSPERLFVHSLVDSLSSLDESVRRHKVAMKGTTAFRLVERCLSSISINLEGKPLKGLQVLGALETRALDFDHIYILSMNEGVYPKKKFRPSFIPDSIRHDWGMNTSRHDDTALAYNFYSMIARAKTVTILYDARVGGTNSGEISRYVAQLLYLSGQKISHKMATFSPTLFTPQTIEICKDDEIIGKLNRYLIEGEDARYFSASAIKDYIECPLRFYLTQIEGLNMEQTNTDFIDSSTYGTIVHSVAENIYKKHFDKQVITAEKLDNLIRQKVLIDRYITEAVNREFYKQNDLTTPLPPEGRLIGKIIRELIVEMLGNEKKFTPFRFVEGEKNRTTRITFPSGRVVNFKAYIDRVDRIKCNDDGSGGLLRCVDYKTGTEDMKFSSVESLFDASTGHYPKAIFQLMLYCNIYAGMEGTDEAIQPYIYNFKTLALNGLQPIRYGSRNASEFVDYHAVNDEYLAGLDSLLSVMFDKNVPFRQAETDKVCTFCSFKNLCKRN